MTGTGARRLGCGRAAGRHLARCAVAVAVLALAVTAGHCAAGAQAGAGLPAEVGR
ncbi:MAG TPA: hypothetical protein VFS20_15675 [Longimicrobium sp.]|nr:hypothetical protein [Longimicrobium sp.]